MMLLNKQTNKAQRHFISLFCANFAFEKQHKKLLQIGKNDNDYYVTFKK